MYKLFIFFLIVNFFSQSCAFDKNVTSAIATSDTKRASVEAAPQKIHQVPSLYQQALEAIGRSGNCVDLNRIPVDMVYDVACVANSFESLIKPGAHNYGEPKEAQKALADAIDQKNYGRFYSIIHNVDLEILKGSHNGLTPMQRSIKQDNLPMVRKLIGKNVFPLKKDLPYATTEQMKRLVGNNLLHGTLPLFLAARLKNPADIEKSVAEDAYINAYFSPSNVSPLDCALEAKRADNVKCLVELGARIEERHLEKASDQEKELFSYLAQNVDTNFLKELATKNNKIAEALKLRDAIQEGNLKGDTVLGDETNFEKTADGSYNYDIVKVPMKAYLEVLKEGALKSDEYKQAYNSLLEKCSNPDYKIDKDLMQLLGVLVDGSGKPHDLVIEVIKEQKMEKIISQADALKAALSKVALDCLQNARRNSKKK